MGKPAAGQGGGNLLGFAFGKFAGILPFQKRPGRDQVGVLGFLAIQPHLGGKGFNGGGRCVAVDAFGCKVLQDFPPAFALAQQLGRAAAGKVFIVEQTKLPGFCNSGRRAVRVEFAAEFW